LDVHCARRGGELTLELFPNAGGSRGPSPSTASAEGDPPALEVARAGRSGRRRRRQATARPHAVFARFSDDEYDVLALAAAAADATITSYVAGTAVLVARGQVRPLPSAVSDAVRELVDARLQLVRYGVLLNQAVARLNATGQADGSLFAAAQRCDAATASLRAATERLGRHR
jgi:hypothetical protein